MISVYLLLDSIHQPLSPASGSILVTQHPVLPNRAARALHVQQVRCVNKNSMLLRHVSIDSACLLQSWLLFQVMKEKSVYYNHEKTIFAVVFVFESNHTNF